MRTNPILSQTNPLRFDSTGSLIAYTHYLIMKGQLAGNLVLDGHNATSEEKDIAKKLQDLSERIARHLAVCKENEIADLLECYDLSYRIGYQKMPSKDFMMRHKERLVKAWKTKKDHIEDSSVFGAIAGEVKYPTGYLNMDFVAAYKSILEYWINTLRKHNTFPATTSYEKYQRLAMIMRENLDNIIDRAQELKERWYNANKVDDLSSLGSYVLRSYRRFISSIPPSILGFKDNMGLSHQILLELSTRKDLNPYDREAFAMALKYNNQLEND